MTGFDRHFYLPVAFVVGVVVTVSVDRLWSTIWHRFRPADVESKSTRSTTYGRSTVKIVDGIEGCIGNTPLIKIRSLSEATGCEILAKAEVRALGLSTATCAQVIERSSQFLNGAGGSPKDRVALRIIKTVSCAWCYIDPGTLRVIVSRLKKKACSSLIREMSSMKVL